jgi:hypothetical protein
MIVGTNTINNEVMMKKNLPITILKWETGLVDKVSYVPVLNSSENERIEMAGTSISKTQGANLKKGDKFA